MPYRNHNWFQCLGAPLAAIPSTNSPLSPLQTRRLAFYRSWITLNRAHEGDVTVAYTPGPTGTASSIAAVALLLPPHARPSWSEPLLAWRTGLLPALIGLGARGMWRVCSTFEGNVGRMIAKGLKDLGIEDGREERLLMCHGCVRNPEWEGRAPARKLLNWAINRFWEKQRAKEGGKGKATPVWLDTTIDDAVRAYEEIGFKVVGECMVTTGTDAKGIKLRKNAGEKEREDGRKVAKQRVMVRIPNT